MKAVLLMVAATLVSSSAYAVLVPQQRGDGCAVVWDLATAGARPGAEPDDAWIVDCTDGDPLCDGDGSANGACVLGASACVQQRVAGACQAPPVTTLRATRVTVRALTGFTLPPLGSEPACGVEGSLVVPVGARPARLTLQSRAGRTRGSNRLLVSCRAPASCPARPGLPARATLSWRRTGSDLDLGYSGENHNNPFVTGIGPTFCLAGCDASQPLCAATAPGVTRLSAPIPVLSNNVPLCLDPRLGQEPTGTIDIADGSIALSTELAADVYILQPSNAVCPRCSGSGVGSAGVCLGGRRFGAPCRVDATAVVVGSGGDPTYQLSSDCPPSGRPVSTIALPLALSTNTPTLDGSLPCPGQNGDDLCRTGTCTLDCSATPPPKGGRNQRCCTSNPQLPCFPSAADSGGTIVRTGSAGIPSPALPNATFPKTASGVLAHVGCVPPTTDATADILSGLPGPGALLLPYDLTITAD